MHLFTGVSASCNSAGQQKEIYVDSVTDRRAKIRSIWRRKSLAFYLSVIYADVLPLCRLDDTRNPAKKAFCGQNQTGI